VRGLRKTRHSSALQRVRPQPLITTCGLELTADLIYTFRTPRSAPHFTTLPRVQPAPQRLSAMTNSARRSSNRNRAFSMGYGERLRKIGVVGGAKRVEERGEHKLTMSAFSFPQFTQIHPNVFFTLIMKPLWRSAAVTTSQSEHRAHQDDTQVLQVQHDRTTGS
jgi:hypothetical protein